MRIGIVIPYIEGKSSSWASVARTHKHSRKDLSAGIRNAGSTLGQRKRDSSSREGFSSEMRGIDSQRDVSDEASSVSRLGGFHDVLLSDNPGMEHIITICKMENCRAYHYYSAVAGLSLTTTRQS